MRPTFAATLVASSCLLALTACGSSDAARPATVTVTATPSSRGPAGAPDGSAAPSASTATTAASVAPTLRATIPAATATATAPVAAPTLRARSRATESTGQDRHSIPAGATRLTPVRASLGGPATVVATITSPTGTIGCDLRIDSYNGCGVQAWIRSNKFPGSNGDPRWWVDLDGGVPTVSQKGDAPWYEQTRATVVPYGSTVYYGTIVCSSAYTGMTCWNTESGHGAFMSRDEFHPF